MLHNFLRHFLLLLCALYNYNYVMDVLIICIVCFLLLIAGHIGRFAVYTSHKQTNLKCLTRVPPNSFEIIGYSLSGSRHLKSFKMGIPSVDCTYSFLSFVLTEEISLFLLLESFADLSASQTPF